MVLPLALITVRLRCSRVDQWSVYIRIRYEDNTLTPWVSPNDSKTDADHGVEPRLHDPQADADDGVIR